MGKLWKIFFQCVLCTNACYSSTSIHNIANTGNCLPELIVHPRLFFFNLHSQHGSFNFKIGPIKTFVYKDIMTSKTPTFYPKILEFYLTGLNPQESFSYHLPSKINSIWTFYTICTLCTCIIFHRFIDGVFTIIRES